MVRSSLQNDSSWKSEVARQLETRLSEALWYVLLCRMTGASVCVAQKDGNKRQTESFTLWILAESIA